MKTSAILFVLAAAASAQTPSGWPAMVAAESYDVKIAPAFSGNVAVTYSSPHFLIASEVKLPLGVVRDMAAVFEATRAAVRAAPLGFKTAAEPKYYLVRLCATPESYARAGGIGGTGACYDGGAGMLILLPNLGIKPTTATLTTEHTPHLFVLKHITTLQMLGVKPIAIPPWMQTGLGESFASAPYIRGRYTFTGLDSALRDYLLKWRRTANSRSLRLFRPSRLMRLDAAGWQSEAAAGQAYDLLNSAAILTHWFLHHDGKGDAADLGAFLDALRLGEPLAECERRHLLRSRTYEELDTALQSLARKMALEVQWQ